MKKYILLMLPLAILAAACNKTGSSDTPTKAEFGDGSHIDFSHVGYHYGDTEIPDLPVVRTLEAPLGDATALIQQAIDETESGAILLKSGVYQVEGRLYLNKSGVVLRGESNSDEGTVILSMARTQAYLLYVGTSNSAMVPDLSGAVEITQSVTPVGQKYVEVADASSFNVGDDILIRRPDSQDWKHDLKMDAIDNEDGETIQWTSLDFTLDFERKVIRIEDNKLYLDNPIIMELDQKYGVSHVMHYTYSAGRIRESGVENIKFQSRYSHDTDEDHGWAAVYMHNCEHCWVRDCNMQYFGYSAVYIYTGGKYITVSNCNSRDPKAQTTGSRKYAFHLQRCEMCLVKDCSCTYDRHQFVVGVQTPGPNVFLRCTSTNSLSDAGPHHRWSMGTLYDNVKTDGELNVQDRGSMGTGHGWAGANYVLWNCEATEIVCQDPWVSAHNWCTGCIGKKGLGARTSPVRPNGQWTSFGKKVQPESLYEYQLATDHENIWNILQK